LASIGKTNYSSWQISCTRQHMHLKDTVCDKNMQWFDFALLQTLFWNVVILKVLSASPSRHHHIWNFSLSLKNSAFVKYLFCDFKCGKFPIDCQWYFLLHHQRPEKNSKIINSELFTNYVTKKMMM
jgi:hypothetical protein